MRIFLTVFLYVFCLATIADHDDHDSIRREYYDYDTEGTRGDRIKRTIGHGTVKVIVSPFRALQKGYRGTKHLVRAAKHNSEIFLSEAASINGEHQKLHQVLLSWENSDDLKTVLDNERKKGNRFLFGLPHDAWVLLKDALEAAGFRIPRAAYHGLKYLVMGYGHLLGT